MKRSLVFHALRGVFARVEHGRKSPAPSAHALLNEASTTVSRIYKLLPYFSAFTPLSLIHCPYSFRATHTYVLLPKYFLFETALRKASDPPMPKSYMIFPTI